MAQATLEARPVTVDRASSRRIAILLSRSIFASLLILIVLTAIPYGTAEAWWKALFASLVFMLAVGWTVEGFVSGSWRTGGENVMLPVVLLCGFSLLQTISLTSGSSGAVTGQFWKAISADPYETRFFLLQLMALTIAGGLFYRYANTNRRITTLIHLIIAVAVASALFGIIRQTTQHQLGFGLPLIKPDQGYGQFINKNHFAFLMEMALGLALGLILAGGVSRDRALFYFASLLPIWTALVLSNSRGGILAMLAQLVLAALLFTAAVKSHSVRGKIKLVRIASSWPVRIALIATLVIGVFIGTIWVGGDRLVSNIEAVRGEFDPTAGETHLGSNRNEIWKATWRMFKAHPIAGVGMGGYWIAITGYHDASGIQTPQEAHSDFLELLASGGVIGFALGAWFALAVFKRIRQNLRSPDRFRRAVCFAATVGIAGVVVHSLVDFGLHMIANALIFTALVTIATRRNSFVRDSNWEQ